MPSATALLAAALPLAANGQAQLLPAGSFAARDGRPGKNLTWKVSDVNGAKLADQLNAVAAATPIVIDYEHQTMLSPDNGQRAPAAGWITSVEWRNGEGLFAEVDWTDAARGHIDAKEYRFISPVIDYDKKTGDITGLHNAALTNFPALTGMKPVIAQLTAQLRASEDELEFDVDLSAIITQLGLQPGATPEQISAHINGLTSTAAAVAQLRTALGVAAETPLTDVVGSIAALRSSLGLAEVATLADIGTSVVALKASSGKPDPATITSMAALQTEVASLKTAALTREVGELVDGAISGKKLLPAQRDWAVNLGMKDVESLRSYVATTASVQGLGGQIGGRGPDDGAPGSADKTALSIAAQMGVSPEAFLKAAKPAA